MGNPKLPVEVTKRRGTYRKGRDPGRGEQLLIPQAAINVPPPATLREHGRAEWEHVLRVCPWIGMGDLSTLRVYCELLDRRNILHEQLFGKGNTGVVADLVLETSTGYAYAHPVLSALLKVEDQLARWTAMLGLSPQARTQLGVAEVKAASTLDRLARRREERALARGASDGQGSADPVDASTPTAESASPTTGSSGRSLAPARSPSRRAARA